MIREYPSTSVKNRESRIEDTETFEIEKSKKSNGASNGLNLIHPATRCCFEKSLYDN